MDGLAEAPRVVRRLRDPLAPLTPAVQVISTALEATDGCSQADVADHDAPRFEVRRVSSPTTPTAQPSTETGMSWSSLIIDRIPSCRQPSQNLGHSKEMAPANMALPSRVNVFTHSKLCLRMRAMRALVAGLLR